MNTIEVKDAEVDAVVEGRRAAERETERAEVRRTLDADKAKKKALDAQVARKRRADEAEQRELAYAPIVKVVYKGITVSIKMSGAIDPTTILTCEEGAHRAIRILNTAHRQQVGAARSRALGGQERDEGFVRLVLRLQDELRHAAKVGAVEVDHDVKKR